MGLTRSLRGLLTMGSDAFICTYYEFASRTLIAIIKLEGYNRNVALGFNCIEINITKPNQITWLP